METPAPRPELPPLPPMADGDETARLAIAAAWMALVAGILFSFFPGIDIAVSRLFLEPDSGFLLAESPFWSGLREVTLTFYRLFYVFIVFGAFLSWRDNWPAFGLALPKWLYLIACSLAGPLFLTNVLLKAEWGRWRPREIVELGGSEPFTSPLDLSGSCPDNCSFVSGEVSSMVMIFISLALVSTRHRPLLYGLTAVMGALAALLRVGQGGHFLSDTLFAAAFMILIAAGLYALFFLGKNPLAAGNSLDFTRFRRAWRFFRHPFLGRG